MVLSYQSSASVKLLQASQLTSAEVQGVANQSVCAGLLYAGPEQLAKQASVHAATHQINRY